MSKKQWKTVDLSLQFSTKTDWSLEEDDAPQSDVSTIRSNLPTTTNATRQTAELDNIPEGGPFILNFANMSFDANEESLRKFFQAFHVQDVRIYEHRRGCGQIEFTNITDLAGAWKLNEKILISRPLRLSIPMKDDASRQQEGGLRPKFQNQQKPSTLNSDESDNWRVKKPQLTPQKEGTAANKESDKAQDAKIAESSDKSAFHTKPPSAVTEDADWRTNTKRDLDPVRRPPVDDKAKARPRSNVMNFKADANIDEEFNWRNRPGRPVEPRGSADTENDNWRKGGLKDETRESMTPSKSLSSKSTEPHGAQVTDPHLDAESSDSTKKSIFGDARPVDTTVKDLEIEAKLEQKKLTAEVPDTAVRPNAWTTKKVVSPPAHPPTGDSGQSLEWRDKSNLGPQRATVPEPRKDQREPTIVKAVVIQSPTKPELKAAPLPTTNVWEERKKSKASTPAVTVAVAAAVVDKKEESVVEEAVLALRTEVGGEAQSPMSQDKVASKPPVVISANGPFIDPKCHRTPQHSVSECKVVPKSPVANEPRPQRSSTDSKSVWARGPPKSLVQSPGGIAGNAGGH